MPKNARQKLLAELDPAPEDAQRLLGDIQKLGGMSNVIGFSLITQQFAGVAVVGVAVFWGAVWGVVSQGNGFDLSSLQKTVETFQRYDTVPGLLQNLLAYICSMFLPFALLVFLLRQHPLHIVPLGRIRRGKWLPAAAAVALGLSFLSALVLAYIEALLGAAHLRLQAPDFNPPSQPLPVALYLLLFCAVAPVCEEFIFRGVVLQSLRRFGNWFAVVFSAALFALMHGNIAQMPLAFLLGLALGIFVLFFESIWATVLLHASVNLFSTLITMVELHAGGNLGGLLYLGIGVGLLAVAIVTVALLQRQGRLRQVFAGWSRPGLPATYLLRRAFTSPGIIVFTVLAALLCISGLRFL